MNIHSIVLILVCCYVCICGIAEHLDVSLTVDQLMQCCT